MNVLLPELAQNGAILVTVLLLMTSIIFTFVFAYHWFTYGTSRMANVTALAVYAGGGALLLLMIWLSASNF